MPHLSTSLLATPSPDDPWPPRPPTNESEEEKAIRRQRAREAKKASHAIEEKLEKEWDEWDQRKEYMKVLIIGQCESGKSTTLKQFQLLYAPTAFAAESEAWRTVIHLNLVRSVNFVLDTLSGAEKGRATPLSSPSRQSPTPSSGLGDDGSSRCPSVKELRMRLAPLQQVEKILVSCINGEIQAANSQRSDGTFSPDPLGQRSTGRSPEVVVRGGSRWKDLLKQELQPNDPNRGSLESAKQILHACRSGIVALWTSQEVQRALQDVGVVLRDQSGFFLDDADRVGSADYVPTFEDILRARLQTVGVEEHRVVVETGDQPHVGKTWLFYDVGGSRHQRASWAPYFDDVNAIIFLCPMSGFDETLPEDLSVNRLLDSFALWKTICSSKVLANVIFILLLNKYDILQSKLESGESFSKWVKSYKDDPYDAKRVSEYLKGKFIAIHNTNSPPKRQLHVHVTSALDVRAMTPIIMKICEVILKANLIESTVL